MNYSTSHIRFSQKVNTPDALTEPQGFLGPNYRTVLNFWTYLDKLSPEQLIQVSDTVENNTVDSRDYIKIRNAAESVIGLSYLSSAYESAFLTSNESVYLLEATTMATEELISMHRLFKDGRSLHFVPMFDFTVNRDFHILNANEIDKRLYSLNNFYETLKKDNEPVINLSYDFNTTYYNPNNLVLTTNP